MSWISEYPLSWIHQICFAILKRGTIPKHIAIVMDGNRRFARKSRVKSYDGHQKGLVKSEIIVLSSIELQKVASFLLLFKLQLSLY